MMRIPVCQQVDFLKNLANLLTHQRSEREVSYIYFKQRGRKEYEEITKHSFGISGHDNDCVSAGKCSMGC